MGDTTKLSGLEMLQARLSEIESGDAEDIAEDVSAASTVDEDEIDEQDDSVDENEEENDDDAKGEIVAKSEELPAGETKKEEENVYSPNYQYKFQDEFFEFDERVKSAIKAPEDEEYFRDLYTKSRAMDLMKTRSEEVSKDLDEYKARYVEVEKKATESDNIVTYFSSILDGINRGDAQSINKLLSLSKVNPMSLQALGLVIAEHLENPQGLDTVIRQDQAMQQQHQLQRTSSDYEVQREALARDKTQFEVQRAITSPDLAELVEYVDGTWGAGTFEKRVWAEGEAMEAQGKSVSLNEIPNIVKNVADWFSKAKPVQAAPSTVPPVNMQTKIVKNPTQSLPNLKGDSGVPVKSHYKEGTGIDGLRNRYKELTGSEW